MTSRYALYTTDQLRGRFAPHGATPKGVKPHYNISPTMRVPVIVWRNDKAVIEQMIWGFVPSGAADTNSVFRYKTYAARFEKILDTHTFRTALRTQRCLIPANGFYEWKRDDSHQPFYIHLKTTRLFAMAGLYSEWQDPNGDTYGMCTVITIASDGHGGSLPRQLPVIVDTADEAAWLNPAINDLSSLFQIIRPSEAALFELFPVDNLINSKKIDTPRLIEKM